MGGHDIWIQYLLQGNIGAAAITSAMIGNGIGSGEL